MLGKRGIANAFAIAAMALLSSLSAQAGASRTFVSTTGNDSNVSVNCSASANCRTFGAALSVTNPGGEVVVVNSGGYGPATISQSVIITAISVDASISVPTSNTNGIVVDADPAASVTLIGLSLHGEATGKNGVAVLQVGFLRMYNILIENFTHDGILFNTSGKLSIYSSEFNDSGNCGISLANGSTYVADTSVDNNSCGVLVNTGATATVANSSAGLNSVFGFVAQGGTLTLSNAIAWSNALGLGATMSGTLYFSNCTITDNATAYEVDSGSTMAGTNPGTNLIVPGQATMGTLGTAIVLQ